MAEDNPKIPDESINADNFREALESATKVVQDFTKKVDNIDVKSIQDLLNLKEEVLEVAESIESLTKESEDSNKKREKYENKDEKIQKGILKGVKKNFSELGNIGRALGAGPTRVTPDITVSAVEATLSPPSPPGGGGGVGGGGSGGGGADGGGPGGGGPSVPGRDVEREVARNYSNFFTRVSSQILGGRGIQDLFSGSLSDVLVYRKNMRMLAYELEGMTENTRGLQAEFANIGDDVERITGLSRDETMQAYEKILKKGVKSRSEAKRMIKSSLHTSEMLGADAQQTADLFGNWHKTLGMSATQMDQMARDARDIAKSTGVTGDELIQVMKRSENIMKNLRDQGNLTSSAMNNIIKGAAEAEKLGVGEGYNKLVDAMTDSHKLFNEADQQTRNLIMRIGSEMGAVPEIINGTFFESRDNMKKFADQMENDFVRMAHHLGAAGVESIEDFNKMDANQRALMNRRMQQMYGMSAEDFIRQTKAVKKGGEGLSDSFANLDKKLKSSTATAEEKALAQKEIDGAMRNAAMRMTNQMSQGIEQGMSVVDAAKKALENKDVQQDLKAMADRMGKNFDAMSDLEKAQFAASVAAQKLTENAKEQGVTTVKVMDEKGKMKDMNIADIGPQMEAAIASGDQARVRELEKAMGDAQKEVDMKEKKGSDPIEETANQLTILNGYLRSLTGGIIGTLVDAIGSNGIIMLGLGAAILGVVPGLGAIFGGLLNGLGGIFGGLGGLLGGRGGRGGGGGGGMPGPFRWLGNWLSDLGKNRVVKGAATLTLLATSLFLVAQGLKTFNDVNWSSFAKGVLALGGLVILAKFISKASTSMVKGAAVIAILAGALVVTAHALKTFDDVNWDSLLKGTVALVALSLATRLIGSQISNMLKGALGIVALGAAMWVAGKGFQTFNDLDWSAIAKGTVALVAFGIVAGIMGALVPYILLGALAIAALGLSVGIFGLAMLPVAYATQIFAEGIVTLSQADGANLLLVGLGLAAVGAGAVAFALGMTAATAGGVISGIASLFGVKSPLERIKEFVPIADKISLIGQGFKNFGDGIRAIAEALKELNAEKLSQLKKSMDEFVKDEKHMEALSKLAASGSKDERHMEALSRLAVSGSRNEEIKTSSLKEFDKISGLLETKPIGTTTAQPTAPIAGVVETLTREKAAAEGTGKLHSDELTRIESAAYSQISELESIREGIQELVSIMKPSGNLSGSSFQESGPTKDPVRSTQVVTFGKIRITPSDGANRSVNNNGGGY